MRFPILLILISVSIGVFSQCPVISVSIPDVDLCLGEELQLTNTSDDSYAFEWDFCDATLDASSFGTTLLSTIGFPRTFRSISFADSSDVWFGYALSAADNSLVRYDFTEGINAPPSSTQTLGNVGGLLTNPSSIEMYEQEGLWYGLILNRSGELIRLTFTNGLQSVPASEEIATGVGANLSKMDLASSRGELKAVIVNSDATIRIVDFQGDITHTPDAGDITLSSSISGISDTRGGIALFKECDQWYGFVSSFSPRSITRLDFGSSLTSTISGVSTLIGDDFGVNEKPNRQGLIYSGGDYYLEVATLEGGLYNVALGTDPLVTGLTSTAVTQYGSSNDYSDGYSLEVLKMDGVWQGYVYDESSGGLYGISYESDCGANVHVSTEKNPIGITYSTAGTYLATLEAENSSGSVDYHSTTVTVQDSELPVVDWSTINQCIDANNVFDVSGGLTGLTLQWDFNNDAIIDFTGESPDIDLKTSYGYLENTTYSVSLYASNVSGCETLVTKDVILYSSPIASFTVPSSNLCTSASLSFGNTTTYDPSSVIVWNWDFDEDDVIDSNDESPSFTYLSSGMKTVKLIVELTDGCQSEHTEDFELSSGPVIDFEWTNNCFEEEVSFLNNSESTGVVYLWDFGDGSSTSTDASPFHMYSTGSSYDVRLTVSSTVTGCESELAKTVVVNDASLLDFTHSSANYYEGEVVSFEGEDLTLSGDEVVSWDWDFGGMDSSMQQDTSLIFDRLGPFEVSLTVTTLQGCTDSIIKTVEIFKFPCPVISVSIPDVDLCLGEESQLTNTSDDSYAFEWDFCDATLDASSFGTTLLSTIGFPRTFRSISFADSADVWFGYALSAADNSLVRYDFTEGFNSPPSLTQTLGNVGGLLSNPSSIEMYEQEGLWYGLILNRSGELIRLTFTNGLQSVPDSEEIATGVGANLSKMDLAFSRAELKAVIVNNDATITIVDFQGDITHTPVGGDITTSVAISGISNLRGGIALFKECDQWYGFLSSFSPRGITRVDFGSSLTSTINGSSTLIGDEFGANEQPNRIGLIHSGGDYHLEVATLEGGLYDVTLGGDPLVTGLTSTSVTQYGLSNSYSEGNSLEVLKMDGVWQGYVYDESSGGLYGISYESDCGANVHVSTEKNPIGITYSTAGTYLATLEVENSSGSVEYKSFEITVIDFDLPTIDWGTSNICVELTNQFELFGEQQGLSFSWDFNSDQIEDSTEPYPTFQYTEPGTYDVRLDVVSDEGCTNFTRQQITIYPEPPVPAFDVSASAFCEGNEIVLTNLTDDTSYDGLVKYHWSATGLNDSITDSDLKLSFESAGQKTITVFSSIPGCESTATEQVIEIFGAPLTDFSATTVCIGELTCFTNLSDEASYVWDFGDGVMSTLNNPDHLFAESGNYAVTLKSTDAIGCENTLTKSVVVSPLPVPIFAYDLLCQNDPATFEDLSFVPQSDVVAWDWAVDGQSVSTEQNPTIVFETSGIHQMALTVLGANDCATTYFEEVNVLETPQLSITSDGQCVGEPVSFSDVTLNQQNVQLRTWLVDGVLQESSEAVLQYTFTEAGLHEIQLNVDQTTGCSGTIQYQIELLEVPVLSFFQNNVCENEEIIVTDNSLDVVGNEIISRSWKLDGVAIGNGEDALLPPVVAGSYALQLEVQTSQGCVLILDQDLAIANSPQIDFTPSNDYGIPPFSLLMSNQTQFATQYSWFVDDQLVSEDAEPIIGIDTEGQKVIKLLASNEMGCVDSVVTTINSALPIIDIEINRIQLIENGANQDIRLEVTNQSNIPIEILNFGINLENSFELSERVNQRIDINQKSLINLSTSIPTGFNELGYLCVDVASVYPATDLTPDNNEKCLNIGSSNPVFEPPYPNPARENVVLRAILPESNNLLITVFDMSGQIQITKKIAEISAGLNIFDVSLIGLESGTYFVRLQFEGGERKFRIIKH